MIFMLAFSCSNTSLKEYASENQQETEIVKILIQYQDAKNNFDLEKYLACLHNQGKYYFGGGQMVSKEELKKLLPNFWTRLQSGDRTFYPMSRESLNGNYFQSGEFINPQIVITQDTADVTVTFTKDGWRLKHYISMVRENNQWLIKRLDWETG